MQSQQGFAVAIVELNVCRDLRDTNLWRELRRLKFDQNLVTAFNLLRDEFRSEWLWLNAILRHFLPQDLPKSKWRLKGSVCNPITCYTL